MKETETMQSKLGEYNKIREEDDGREILPLRALGLNVAFTNYMRRARLPRQGELFGLARGVQHATTR